MSRIRGFEAKALKDGLSSRKNGFNEGNKNKNEDQALYSKDDAEKKQISELLHKLPKLDKIFNVYRKIGEGTFSSVYLGALRQHDHRSDADKQWFAIKHLVPTSHPARIEHELKCLQDMGGKNHVIGVELCLRHFDTIVFIMPYIPHRKFSEYVGDMGADELRDYMRALLEALRHVHSFGVIHRDVKPSNFLYDRENKRYQLVDFGLAQRLVSTPPPSSQPLPPPAHANSVCKRPREEEDSSQCAKRMALDLTVGSKNVVPTPVPKQVIVPKVVIPKMTIPKSSVAGVKRLISGALECACAGAGGVCGPCAARPQPRAPRAGTQGFRPPEVLLKFERQSTAVDVWAAGVVLVSVLCARYPFFRAPDDLAALAELAALLGAPALQRTAHALGRRLVWSCSRRGVCLRRLCRRLRGAPSPGGGPPGCGPPGAGEAPSARPASCSACRLPEPECVCCDNTIPPGSFSSDKSVCGFPDSAFSLATLLLEPDPHRRIDADKALKHAFFTEPTPKQH